LKRRTVTFTPEARNDLLHLGDWIAERAGVDVAQVNAGNNATTYALAYALSASNDASPSPSPSPTSR
jgi:plasmid stabilization system protein ParE